MMRKGGILGYDLNEKNCQISYYDETKEEPETMGAAADNFQIPLILGYYRERWVFGMEAKRLASLQEGTMVNDLFEKAVRREKVKIGSTRCGLAAGQVHPYDSGGIRGYRFYYIFRPVYEY